MLRLVMPFCQTKPLGNPFNILGCDADMDDISGLDGLERFNAGWEERADAT
jgi:hypothetical protein